MAEETSFVDRVTSGGLPLLLAGPILRRAEASQVWIWIATSEEAAVEAEVFAEDGRSAGRAVAAHTLTAQVGRHLFVHLLCARPHTAQFGPTFLTYDVRVNGMGLPRDDERFAYSGFALPSFYLPKQTRTLFFGSCRKPHGGNILSPTN